MGDRNTAMLRTPVPKASVNENSHLGRPEHEIGSSIEVPEGLSIDHVSKATAVDSRANG